MHYQLALSHRMVGRCLDDFSDAEAARRPGGVLAPAVWHVGHLAAADLKFLEAARIVPRITVPEGYAALFRQGTGEARNYPPLREVADAFDASHEAVVRAVGQVDLDAAVDNSPGPFVTCGEMFSFTAAHRWYHIGKIASLRGLLGKPRPPG